MLCGPSGIGKTTIADHISKNNQLDYISGSMSDLIPDTKKTKHSDMLSRSSEVLLKEDYHLINLRNKAFKDLSDFVTDRSYVDSAAYFIYKQSTHLPTCEVDQFIGLCKMLLNQQCDLLIFLSLLPEDVSNWVVENNNKRVLNTYYQVQMSTMMGDVLSYMGLETEFVFDSLKPGFFNKTIDLNRQVTFGNITTHNGVTKVLTIPDLNKEHRIKIIDHFIFKMSCRKKL